MQMDRVSNIVLYKAVILSVEEDTMTIMAA